MPSIEIIQGDRTGQYRLKFDKDTERDFYGEKVTELRAFRLYGNLPDNHVLGNKLINNLGKNLLHLEQEALRINADESISEGRKKQIEFYGYMERESNAFNIRVLEELSSLEQARFYDDNPSDKMAIQAMKADRTRDLRDQIKLSADNINKINGEIAAIKAEQTSLQRIAPTESSRARYGELDKQLLVLQSNLDQEEQKRRGIQDEIASLESEDPTKIKKLYRESLAFRIKKLYEDRVKRIEKQIDAIKDTDPEAKIKRAELERLKSVMFNNQVELFSKINDSKTSTQTIYRKVMDCFADEQRLISIYQRRADRPLTYANQSLTEAYQNASYAMEKHVFALGSPTDEQLWRETLHDGDITITTSQYPSMRKEDALYSACLVSTSENAEPVQRRFEKAKKNISANSIKTKTTASVPRADSKEQHTEAVVTRFRSIYDELKNPAAAPTHKPLPPERPVHLYRSSDLFSAMGLACMDFGKYFEAEMGAKKPVLTMAMFVAMSATFGAAGLAASGVTSMNGVVHIMSQILTLNGKIGISVDQMQNLVTTISNQWMSLTYSEGSVFHALIMNGFGLPKLIYLAADSILNSSEHRDTLKMLAQSFASQDLAGYTDEEKLQTIVRNTMVASAVLVAAIALGVGADVMAHASPAILKALGSGVGTLVDVPIATFTSLGSAVGASAEVLAIFALVLTVKSAGLFIGKIALVLNHMGENQISKEEREACLYMAALKDIQDSGGTLPNNELFTEAAFEKHSKIFAQLIAKNPNIAKEFGSMVGIAPPNLPGYKTAGNTFASGARTLFVDYILKGTLKPLVQVAIGVPLAITTGYGVFWGKNVKDPLEIKEGFWIALKLVSNIGLMATAAGKTITNSVYGTLQRLTMAASDIVFDLAALGNYAISGFPSWKPITAPLLFIAKIGATVGGLATEIVRFGVNVAKYALVVPTAVVGGVIGGLVSAVYGAVTGSKENALKAWNNTMSFIKSPITLGNFINEKGINAVKNWLGNRVHDIDKELYSVSGADKIMNARNATTAAISQGFDWLKRQLGEAAYQIRNVVVRTQERREQAAHQEIDRTTDGAFAKDLAAFEVAASVTVAEHYHLQGLDNGNASHGPDGERRASNRPDGKAEETRTVSPTVLTAQDEDDEGETSGAGASLQ